MVLSSATTKPNLEVCGIKIKLNKNFFAVRLNTPISSYKLFSSLILLLKIWEWTSPPWIQGSLRWTSMGCIGSLSLFLVWKRQASFSMKPAPKSHPLLSCIRKCLFVASLSFCLIIYVSAHLSVYPSTPTISQPPQWRLLESKIGSYLSLQSLES